MKFYRGEILLNVNGERRWLHLAGGSLEGCRDLCRMEFRRGTTATARIVCVTPRVAEDGLVHGCDVEEIERLHIGGASHGKSRIGDGASGGLRPALPEPSASTVSLP